ncbi:MAG TPA: S8/S53 family peptidase [Thermoanaerobaculia bacterium]|nr:S8/S53 family peptidase [Thermoanaerobaculia bacterium]
MGILLCGCRTFCSERPEHPDLSGRPKHSERLDTASACTDWRWIAIKSRPEVHCPEVPGWTVSSLFSQVAPVERECSPKPYPGEGPSLKVIRELNRFCVYEITDRSKKLRDLPFPPSVSADLVRFDQDCAALSVSADPTPNVTPWPWEQYSEQFLAQAGKPKTPMIIDGHPRVRLAFLDNHPTGTGVPAWAPHVRQHGYTLAHIARNLLCSPESPEHCAALITTQLALPISKFDPKNPQNYETDTTHGGYLGLQSDVAKAIWEEVRDWQKDRQRPGWPQHLVLNLSLAWDGNLFGGLDEGQLSELRAGTQAVYRSLEYAAGFDTLVLAAAGNRKRAPCSNLGPLLPAAWEMGGSPEESCHELHAPLVYAVGALGSKRKLLDNSREAAMPQRAAFGEGAVVPSERPDQPTALYSGTSISTAVVSSIAAAVWHFLPGLTSRQLMQLLDESGADLGYPADFWFGSKAIPPTSAPTVHLLSFCSVLQDVCTKKGLSPCPVSSCESRKQERVLPDGYNTLAPGSCQPWVYPQPEDPPCPNPGCHDTGG